MERITQEPFDATEQVPDFHEFREAIDKISMNKRDKALIKFIYLTAARCSEVVTRVTEFDRRNRKSYPYGQHVTWRFHTSNKPKDTLLIRMALAKRRKKTKQGQKTLLYKIIALPVDKNYEPWIIDLLKYLQRHQGRLNFDLTRQRVFQIVRENLGDFIHGIHPHSLRHFRLTHLVSHYNFDPYEVTAFAGWSYSTGFGGMGVASSQLDTYLHLSWQRYYPKLLRPIEESSRITV